MEDALDERILRSLTGSQIPPIGSTSIRRYTNNEFEESDSNSSKSEADEPESSQL